MKTMKNTLASPAKLGTIFGNLFPSDVATAANLHGYTRQKFMLGAQRDGGVYGEAPRVHFSAEFAEVVGNAFPNEKITLWERNA